MQDNQVRHSLLGCIATLLLLRWVDYTEAERQEAAVFEGRPYRELLPPSLKWTQWAKLEEPSEIAARCRELSAHVNDLQCDSEQPTSYWLRALGEPLRLMAQIGDDFICQLVRQVDALSFETPSERREQSEWLERELASDEAYFGQFSSPANIAGLVAVLANPKPGEQVYDPCFGLGNFLIAAWNHAESGRNKPGRSGPLLDVAGAELNSGAFLIGLVRILFAGIGTPRVEWSDSLRREPASGHPQQGFDVVVANPPFGNTYNPLRFPHSPIATYDRAGQFIQHALSQLKPHGRAVIIVPESFLFRGGPERELRHDLVEKGQVEAVIGLPQGVFAPYTSVKVSVLVLNKQGGADRVRMMDAAPFFETTPGRKAPWISPAMAQQLSTEIRHPSTSGSTPGTAVLSRSVWDVYPKELASVDWDLSPRRREKGGFEELLTNLKNALGETGSIVTLSSVARVNVGRAIKPHDLQDTQPTENPVGYIRTKDINKGKVGRFTNWLTPKTATTERRWSLLPGDVLVSRSGRKAAIARDGIVAVAAKELFVLRTDRERLDPGFLLAYLSSPVCQNWLTAHSYGTVTQHITLKVLDDLPMLLPPLRLQAQAATQFREYGMDVLGFLARIIGTDGADLLAAWLAKLSRTLEDSGTSVLEEFEILADVAAETDDWLHREEVASSAAGWLRPFTDGLLILSHVTQIPSGTAKLTVLQEAERSMVRTLEHITGHFPTESQARVIVDDVRNRLRGVITSLLDNCSMRVRSAPTSLVAGRFSEFVVEVEADWLPLRRIQIISIPHLGEASQKYLGENEALQLYLRGDIPTHSNQLSLQLRWSAQNLIGDPVVGTIELAIPIASTTTPVTPQSAELGGSPYVTGSPLEPSHGHEVFFGREEVIKQITRQIATCGNVVLLEGNRRAGKTSILKHLEGFTAIPGWLVVYSSLQGAEGATNATGVPTPDVFREIARCIAIALAKRGIDVPLPNGQTLAASQPAFGVARACREGISSEGPFTDFHNYWQRVLPVIDPLALGLVLMLDEFDKLQEGIENGVTSPQVPENIRFLIQAYPKFSAILTGSRRLKRLREQHWSALYGLGTSIQVTALDLESARRVVRDPVKNKLAYSNESVERIIDLTARQPYLLQCLCNRIFDIAVQTQTRSITLSTVNNAATSLVRDNEHFASLWDYAGLGPETGRHRRQLILLRCAQSLKEGTHTDFGTLREQLAQVSVDVDDDALDADLAYLRELELVDLLGDIGGGRYRLAIPLMADWITQQQDAAVVINRAAAEAEEENV